MIRIAAGTFLLVYVAYCWREQGIHTRHEGWKTRDEAPKTFAWTMWFYVLFAIVLIVYDVHAALFKSKPLP